MKLVLFCELSWQWVVLISWILTLITIVLLLWRYFWYKFSVLPKSKHKHEEQMKEDAFKREKEWKELINLKTSTDDALKDQVEKLAVRKNKLEKELEAEKNNICLLEKQLKLYSDIFEKLNIEIKPKEKK